MSTTQKDSRKKALHILLNREVIDKKTDSSLCSICLGTFRNPVSTSCGHKYCWDCIEEWYISNKHECPQCRTHLSLFDTSIINKRDEEKITKFTKPVKLIHPAISSDSRFFGGTTLENENRDRPNWKLLLTIISLFSAAWFVYSTFFK